MSIEGFFENGDCPLEAHSIIEGKERLKEGPYRVSIPTLRDRPNIEWCPTSLSVGTFAVCQEKPCLRRALWQRTANASPSRLRGSPTTVKSRVHINAPSGRGKSPLRQEARHQNPSLRWASGNLNTDSRGCSSGNVNPLIFGLVPPPPLTLFICT